MCVVHYAVIKTNSVDTQIFTANPKQVHVSAEQSSQNQAGCVLFFTFTRHWVGFDFLTDFPPLLSRLHINSPISPPNPCDGLLCLVAPPQIRSGSPNSNSSWFCTKDFLSRINFFHPYHMSSPSESIKLNKGRTCQKM